MCVLHTLPACPYALSPSRTVLASSIVPPNPLRPPLMYRLGFGAIFSGAGYVISTGDVYNGTGIATGKLTLFSSIDFRVSSHNMPTSDSYIAATGIPLLWLNSHLSMVPDISLSQSPQVSQTSTERVITCVVRSSFGVVNIIWSRVLLTSRERLIAPYLSRHLFSSRTCHVYTLSTRTNVCRSQITSDRPSHEKHNVLRSNANKVLKKKKTGSYCSGRLSELTISPLMKLGRV